jgi:hypothetical protein
VGPQANPKILLATTVSLFRAGVNVTPSRPVMTAGLLLILLYDYNATLKQTMPRSGTTMASMGE